MSKIATGLDFIGAFEEVKSLFAKSLLVVDFPADLGPHMSVVRFLCLLIVSASDASFLFHAGGETSSWMTPRFGASSDENS
jgi:hypothetical protein